LAPGALELDRGGYQVWSGDRLPDHNAPGQSYAEQIAMMLHRDFDTAAQIVPISDVFLCKVTGQTLGETNRTLFPLHRGWDVADTVAQG
jgi:hypothetical protein